jgi:hypothetical protein
MAVRKTYEDTFVVSGEREQWLVRCKQALVDGGFSKVQPNEELGQIKADFKKMTVWGTIEITLFPDGENTKVVAKATANVDNVYALFSSPGKTILNAFKENLT